MVKGSGNWVKQKRRIAKLAAKVRNQRADFLHKTANRLAARYDCVGVEDLDMKDMSQSLALGKSTMDNGYGMFRTMLAYKLERQGKQLVTVDRFYRPVNYAPIAATTIRIRRTCISANGHAPIAGSGMTGT